MESGNSTSSYFNYSIPDQESRNEEYKELSSKLSVIHSSYLFFWDNIRERLIPQLCRKIFTVLVRYIGGTQSNQSGWKDFGYYLGLTTLELNYIDQTIKSCPTEMVLRVFSQGEESTISIITDSLFKMERFDILEQIYEPLKELLEALGKTEEGDRDQGYCSNSSEKNALYRVDYFGITIPEALLWPHKRVITNDIDRPTVLLTYHNDGIKAVEKIMAAFKTISMNKPINVIRLEDIKSTIVTNPEEYIREYFDKAKFIFPILTKGYLEAINSPAIIRPSIMDNIDCAYVKFIYTLMTSHYIMGKGCRNTQVRSLLIDDDKSKGVLDQLYKYSVLSVYLEPTLKNLEKLFI